jgi:hypothetical protein
VQHGNWSTPTSDTQRIHVVIAADLLSDKVSEGARKNGHCNTQEVVPDCVCSGAAAGVNDLPETRELDMMNLAMPADFEPDCMRVVESVTMELSRAGTRTPTRIRRTMCNAQLHNLECGQDSRDGAVVPFE